MTRYGTIICDFPWEYRNRRRGENGLNGTAAQHYDPMTVAQGIAMPVGELAAPDAVLLQWVTNPHLEDGLTLGRAWGFKYVTKIPWFKIDGIPALEDGRVIVKPQVGVGFWARGVSEDVLLMKRGAPTRPVDMFLGILSENFGHSRKPDNLYQYAEALAGPYLELFARRRRPGWDAFGNQVEGSISLPSPSQAVVD